jgi:hypothetical protein
MDPNEITLNPGADISGKLVCSHCGEEIEEVSYENQNRFECGCEKPVKFEIPTEDKTSSEDSDEDDNLLGLDKPSKDLYNREDCQKCGGTGKITIYMGKVGGSVECDRCNGTGKSPYANIYD